MTKKWASTKSSSVMMKRRRNTSDSSSKRKGTREKTTALQNLLGEVYDTTEPATQMLGVKSVTMIQGV
jgi:hypothetical protein